MLRAPHRTMVYAVRMHLSHFSAIALLLSCSLVACEGPEGPAGDPGPAGSDGTPGMPGTDGTDGMDGTNGMDGMDGAGAAITEVSGSVASSAGPAAAGTPVALVAIDDTGAEIGTFGGTLTDANGDFSLSVDDDVVASTRLALRASSDGEDLSSPLVSDTGVTIDPVATGVLSAILLITETPEGRVLADYTPTEFSTLYTAADTALTTANTDLSDPQAVLDEIIDSVGGQVADLSEGMYGTSNMLPAPADVSAPFTFASSTAELDLVASDGAVFDIQTDGQVDNGSSGDGSLDACDDCFVLEIDSTVFTAGTAAQIEDGDELVVGPTTLSGLDVTRKIYVDPNGPPVVRYTEILVNPTAAAITVQVDVKSDLGSDSSTSILNTSSNDATVDATDSWFYSNDSAGDPIVAMWFGTGMTAQSQTGDDFTTTWGSVTVPANSQVTFIYFGAFFDDGTSATTVEDTLSGLPETVLTGLAPSDAMTVFNTTPPQASFIEGEAGSVGSFADITVMNTTTSNDFTATAASDGSFSVALPNAVSGDSITLTATDGTNDMFMIP